jgi:hypothetical protein
MAKRRAAFAPSQGAAMSKVKHGQLTRKQERPPAGGGRRSTRAKRRVPLRPLKKGDFMRPQPDHDKITKEFIEHIQAIAAEPDGSRKLRFIKTVIENPDSIPKPEDALDRYREFCAKEAVA